MMTLDSMVSPSQNQVSCELEGEAAVLHLKAGRYYGLDPVGVSVWRLIQKKLSVRQILNALLEQYDTAPSTCEKDLFSLLRQLEKYDLVEIRLGKTP